MGTGRSRAGLTAEQSLKLVESRLLEQKERIHGKISIVVYRKDIEKLKGIS